VGTPTRDGRRCRTGRLAEHAVPAYDLLKRKVQDATLRPR
jgi:hypothetical protein